MYSGLYEVEITIVFSNGNPYFITKEYTHTQGMDAYEPDNSYENATWYDVALFETQYHNFYEINDEDWINFKVDEKDIHKISINHLGRENDVRFKLLKGMDVLYNINNAGLQSDEKFEIDLDPGTYYLCILPTDESIFGTHTQYSLTIGKKSAEGFSFCATINDFLTNMLINNAEFYAFANGQLHSSHTECIFLGNEDCDKVSAAQINYFEETKIIGVAASKLEEPGVVLKLWPENKGILILNIKSQGNPVTNASILHMCDHPYTITSDCFGNYTMINVPVDTVFQLNVDHFKPMSIQSTLYYKDVLESSQKFQVRTRFIHDKIGLAEAIYLKNYLISEPVSISHCKSAPFKICIDNERSIENFDLNQSDTELFFHNYLMQCKSYRSSFNIYPDIFPDYNDDGIVDLKDLIYVLKVLAMYSEEDLNI